MRKGLAFLLFAAAQTILAAPDTILFVGSGMHSWTPETVNREIFDDLAEHGFPKLRIVPYSKLSRADLLSAKIVVFANGERRFMQDERDREAIKALVEYVRLGGGLVITSWHDQILSFEAIKQVLLEQFGSGLLMEKALVPESRCHRVGSYDFDLYAYTDRVFPPFDEGVTNVVFSAFFRECTMFGISGCRLAEGWRCALSAGADVGGAPIAETGVTFFDRLLPKTGTKGDLPIVAVREFGKGRVVWFGYHGVIFTRPTNQAETKAVMRQVVRDGLPGMPPSDLGRFVRNVFSWASAHSSEVCAAAVPQLRTAAEFDLSMGTGYRRFRGVVGPRTVYSGGKSTVDDYVKRAKELGLDYIAFLEDFERLSADDFERLCADCRRVTDATFKAWPGYTILNGDGNPEFCFSDEPIYPGRAYLTPDGRRFNRGTPGLRIAEWVFWHSKVGFTMANGWYGFNDSPYSDTDIRGVQSIGVLTRVNGKTVENSLGVMAANNRNGQELMPYALELMDDAKYLTASTYRTDVCIDGVAAFRRLLMSRGVNSGYPSQGCYGCQSVTSGPEIEFTLPRGDMGETDERLYSVRLGRWPYKLSVSSSAGLSDVVLMDGDREVRRWRANGAKSFSAKGVFTNERQHYYWIHAFDVSGGEAFTRAVDSNSFLLRELQCADRNNQLLGSYQRRKSGEKPMHGSYGADTCLHDKGPWHGRLRTVGFYMFDAKYGLGGAGGFDGSPEDVPKLWLSPSISWGDKAPESLRWVSEFVAGKTGGAHVRPRRVVASSDALVADSVMDGTFPASERSIRHVWSTLMPVEKCAWADARARCSLFLPKVDGMIPYQYESSVKVREPIPLPTDPSALFVQFGRLARASLDREVVALVGGAVLSNAYQKTLQMNAGDAIVVKNEKYGSLAVWTLAPVTYKAGVFGVSGFAGGMAQAGDTHCFRIVSAGMHRGVSDPVAFTRDAIAKYRRFAPQGGVVADVAAQDGGMSMRLDGLGDLPGTLGLRLSGLADNRSAVLVLPDGRMRVVPVEGGTAYVALGDEESDKDFFVGHAVRVSDPRVGVFLSRTGNAKGWTVEFHNPTGERIPAVVEPDARVDVEGLPGEIVLEPGTSAVHGIGSGIRLRDLTGNKTCKVKRKGRQK